jgi:hypothetical protein
MMMVRGNKLAHSGSLFCIKEATKFPASSGQSAKDNGSEIRAARKKAAQTKD